MKQDWLCSREIKNRYSLCTQYVIIIIIFEFLSFTGFPGWFYTEYVRYMSDTKNCQEKCPYGEQSISGEGVRMGDHAHAGQLHLRKCVVERN